MLCRKAACAALVLLLCLSSAVAEPAMSETSLPDSLIGCTFVNSDDLSGISLRFDIFNSFTMSNWRSEDREGFILGIYHAEFHGWYDSVSMLDDGMTYELRISSINRAGGKIYDILLSAFRRRGTL